MIQPPCEPTKIGRPEPIAEERPPASRERLDPSTPVPLLFEDAGKRLARFGEHWGPFFTVLVALAAAAVLLLVSKGHQAFLNEHLDAFATLIAGGVGGYGYARGREEHPRAV